jgi:hypothetical protein
LVIVSCCGELQRLGAEHLVLRLPFVATRPHRALPAPKAVSVRRLVSVCNCRAAVFLVPPFLGKLSIADLVNDVAFGNCLSWP